MNYFYTNPFCERFSEWIWIGDRDQFENDVYYWLDGTRVENFDTNWALDEPDGGNHDFMYMRDNEDWAWGDEPDFSRRVLCEIDLWLAYKALQLW